jgi:hypothetical protein
MASIRAQMITSHQTHNQSNIITLIIILNSINSQPKSTSKRNELNQKENKNKELSNSPIKEELGVNTGCTREKGKEADLEFLSAGRAQVQGKNKGVGPGCLRKRGKLGLGPPGRP